MLIKSLIAFSLAGMLMVIVIAFYYGDEPRPAFTRGLEVIMVYLAVIAIFIAITRLIGVI